MCSLSGQKSMAESQVTRTPRRYKIMNDFSRDKVLRVHYEYSIITYTNRISGHNKLIAKSFRRITDSGFSPGPL